MKEDSHAVVVDFEEGGERVELVGGADGGGGGVADVEAIAVGEEEFAFGGEGAFDVEVEFEFGEIVDKGVHQAYRSG